MKLYHFTILFSILLLAIGGTIVQQDRYRKLLEREKTHMDGCVDDAVDAAAGHLAVYNDGMLQIDKEKALEVFLNHLYASLGILDNIPAQQQVVSCIPFLLVVDEEGYYLWHLERNASREKLEESKKTEESEKLEKLEEAEELEKSEQPEKSGYAHYWEPKGFFEDFAMSRSAAVESILKGASESYNTIAKDKGLEYSFLLPKLDDCLWLRGAEEPGIFVFLQGLPLRHGNQLYSKFSFAGAVIHKK